MSRLVLPGYPHHVTQRGNRSQRTFFRDADYGTYFDLLARSCSEAGVACWAYCFMPNHVHLILVPQTGTGLATALKRTHQLYTRAVNGREGWTGCLWQGRFFSCPMDEAYWLAATRYVENNPVRAGLVRDAADWRWSIARAHIAGRPDALLSRSPLEDGIASWTEFLAVGLDIKAEAELALYTKIGMPLGGTEWIAGLEKVHGRRLRPERWRSSVGGNMGTDT